MPPLEQIITKSLAHFALGFWVTFVVCGAIWFIFFNKKLVHTRYPPNHYLWLQSLLSPVIFIAFVGGVANSLVDADHLLLLLGGTNGRILHIPFLIAAIAVSVIFGWKLVAIYQRGYPMEVSEIHISLLAFGISISVISHIAEDYLLGWF